MISENTSLRSFIILSLFLHIAVMALTQFKSHPQASMPAGLAIKLGQLEAIVLPQKLKKNKPSVVTEKNSSPVTPVIQEQVATTQTQVSSFTQDSIQARYNGLIAKMINDQKHYPRMARTLRQEGLVLVKMTLDKDGNIIDLDVLEKPHYQTLVNAALETIKSVKRFPPIPQELGKEILSFNIPIDYRINL